MTHDQVEYLKKFLRTGRVVISDSCSDWIEVFEIKTEDNHGVEWMAIYGSESYRTSGPISAFRPDHFNLLVPWDGRING